MDYPTSGEIDPEKAKYLYENHCAILILEDLPPGSEFGIDMVVYRTGEKFKGVKLIPPGVHLVYASSVDKNNQQTLGPRCGFFHEFKEREILVKKWSVMDEDFDDSFEPDEDYLTRYSDNLRELDRFLGPYDFKTYVDYKNITSMLTPEIVRALMPDCQKLRSVPYLTRQQSDTDRRRIPRASLNPPKPSEDTIVPDLKPDPATVIHFTRIPSDHLNTDQDILENQITQYNLDTTIKLGHCFPHLESRNRLLAEFQFAFITFLLCHIYECFEHWKSILGLICLVDSGIPKLPCDFFLNFIDILTCQVKQIPGDLFEDIVDSNNLIRNHIDIFLQNIDSHGHSVNNDFKRKASDLKQLLEQRFGWQFGLQDDEDQPVVVEL